MPDVVARLLAARRHRPRVDPGHRRARPDRAPPAAGVRRHRLHPAAATTRRCWPSSRASTVVADFRSRDVAAGGQGAPLAPFFHQAVFGRAGETVGVLNIGGISNLTLLRADGSMLGFDCGPGNALMDGWCRQHTGQPYDAEGAWAASGQVRWRLCCDLLLGDPYFPPAAAQEHRARPVQPDLARRASEGLRRGGPGRRAGHADRTDRHGAAAPTRCGTQPDLSRLIVCGGGALNSHLMRRLQRPAARRAGVVQRRVRACRRCRSRPPPSPGWRARP